MEKDRKRTEKPRAREAAPEGELCWGRNPVISLLEESPERCMKVLISETMQPHVKTKIITLCREGGCSIPERGTGRARPPHERRKPSGSGGLPDAGEALGRGRASRTAPGCA